MRSLFCCTLLALNLFAGNAQAAEDLQWVEDQSRNLSQSYQNLQDKVGEVCGQALSLQEMRLALQPEFRDLMQDWQRFNVLMLPPMVQMNYHLIVQMFPDSRGRAKKELLAFYLNDLSVEKLRFTGRGIPALEILLFDEADSFINEASSKTDKTCDILHEIPRHLNETQSTLMAEVTEFTTSSTELKFYEEAHHSILTSLEAIKKNKTARPLRANFDQDSGSYVFSSYRGQLAESHRSGLSAKNMVDNLNAIGELFAVSLKPLLIEKQASDVAEKFAEQLQEAQTVAQSLVGTNFVDIVEGSAEYDRLKLLFGNVVVLIGITKRDVATTLEIPVKFNSNDGD